MEYKNRVEIKNLVENMGFLHICGVGLLCSIMDSFVLNFFDTKEIHTRRNH